MTKPECPDEGDLQRLDERDSDADGLWEHLDGCSPCRERLRTLRQIVGALRGHKPDARWGGVRVDDGPRGATAMGDETGGESWAFEPPDLPASVPPTHAETTGTVVMSGEADPGPTNRGGPCAGTERYQLGDVIGHGGMGAVYRGRDEALRRDLAVKVLLDRHRDDPGLMARFVDEAQIGGQLQHPGVVPVHDLGTLPDGRPYFAMKLVGGNTLAKLLSERRTPADDLARFLGNYETVVQTMAYAHSKRVIHRDLKPANVMVGDFGEVQVMDWGLAKVLAPDRCRDGSQDGVSPSVLHTARSESDSELTTAGSAMGTYPYMPREQARGEVHLVDERADVFGLGSILCEILTGDPPYTGTDAERRRKAREADLGEALDRLERCGADGELIALAGSCLRPDPEDRPRDASVLAMALEAHQAGVQARLRAAERARVEATAQAAAERIRAVEATAQAAAERIRADAERARRKLVIALAAAVFLAALAVGGTYLSRLNAQQATALAKTEEGQRRMETARVEQSLGQTLREEGSVDRGSTVIAHALEAVRDQEEALSWELRADLDAMRRQVHRLEHALALPDKANGMALSPDGKLLLTGTPTGAQLRDPGTGKPTGVTIRGGGDASSVAFNPDGDRILTGGKDGVAQVWDAVTGQPVGDPMVHRAPIRAVVFSLDGRFVATATYGRRIAPQQFAKEEGWARVWDASTGRPVTEELPHKGWVWTVAFSPDSRTLVTAGTDAVARLWDAADGRLVASLRHDFGYVFWAGYRPDGRSVLTVGADGSARLWDPSSGRQTARLKHHDAVLTGAFSRDGKSFATGCGDGTVWLYDADSRSRIGGINHHQGPISSLGYSPDGRALLSGSRDGTARLWDAKTGRPMGGALQHPEGVEGVVFSPNFGTLVTTCKDNVLRVWKVSRSRTFEPTLVHSDAAWVYGVAFTPDGSRLLTGGDDGVARLWRPGSAEPAAPPLRHASGSKIRAVAVSRDGRVAATGGADGQAQLWDLATGREVATIDHGKAVNALAFDPDGRLLTGGDDGVARLWRPGSAEPAAPPLRHAPGSKIRAVAISPRGEIVATGGTDGVVRLWEARSSRQVGVIRHEAAVNALAFGPDGRRLLIGGDDGVARIWVDRSTAPASWRSDSIGAVEPPMRLDGSVLAVAFSSDGRVVATGGTDRKAHLWDAESGRRIGPTLQRQLGFIQAIAFAPDSQSLVTAAADGTAQLWDVPRPAEDTPRPYLRSQVETNLRFERFVGEIAVFRPLTHQEWRKALAELHR